MAEQQTPDNSYQADQFYLKKLIDAGFPEQQAQIIYNSLIKNINRALLAGDEVQLKGFGNFHAGYLPPKGGKKSQPKDKKATSKEKKEKIIFFKPAPPFLKLLAQFAAYPIPTASGNYAAISRSGNFPAIPAPSIGTLDQLTNEPTTNPSIQDNAITDTSLVAEQSEAVTMAPAFPELAIVPDNESGQQQPDFAVRMHTGQNDEERDSDLSDTEDDLIMEMSDEPELPMDPQAQFDYHYQIAEAYKEMTLYQLAIEELDQSLTFISPYNATDRLRYIRAAHLLALSYHAMGDSNTAIEWLQKGLTITENNSEEYKALRYELGLVYESVGELEKATEAYFEVFAADINYRKVMQKLKTLQSRYIRTARGERRPQLIPVIVRGRNMEGKRFEEDSLIVNISRRGACLRISRALNINSFLELRFTDFNRVKLAKVAWCASATGPQGGYHVGLMVYNEAPINKEAPTIDPVASESVNNDSSANNLASDN